VDVVVGDEPPQAVNVECLAINEQAGVVIGHFLAAVDTLGRPSTEGGRHRSPATRTCRRSAKFGSLRDQRLGDWPDVDGGGRARERETRVTERGTGLLLEERRNGVSQHRRHGLKIVQGETGTIGIFPTRCSGNNIR